MLIYKATSKLTGLSYIGYTKDLAQRKAAHIRTTRKKVRYDFHRAIEEQGEENFEWVILESGVDEKIVKHTEIYYIDLHGTYRNGYNMTVGGDGSSTPSTEARQKISEANKGNKYCLGRKVSDETKNRIRDSRIGKCIGEDNPNYGGLSETHKQNISLTKRGNNNPMHGRCGENAPQSKEYVLIDPDGNEVKVFGMADFCRKNGLNAQVMYQVISGKVKKHKGYTRRS